jgi:hypothetical protein
MSDVPQTTDTIATIVQEVGPVEPSIPVDPFLVPTICNAGPMSPITPLAPRSTICAPLPDLAREPTLPVESGTSSSSDSSSSSESESDDSGESTLKVPKNAYLGCVYCQATMVTVVVVQPVKDAGGLAPGSYMACSACNKPAVWAPFQLNVRTSKRLARTQPAKERLPVRRVLFKTRNVDITPDYNGVFFHCKTAGVLTPSTRSVENYDHENPTSRLPAPPGVTLGSDCPDDQRMAGRVQTWVAGNPPRFYTTPDDIQHLRVILGAPITGSRDWAFGQATLNSRPARTRGSRYSNRDVVMVCSAAGSSTMASWLRKSCHISECNKNNVVWVVTIDSTIDNIIVAEAARFLPLKINKFCELLHILQVDFHTHFTLDAAVRTCSYGEGM